MAWIESHQELGRHPKTKKLARLLGVSLPAAVGHLFYLWWWALDFAQDGDLTSFDSCDIADAALYEGDCDEFVSALCTARFCDMTSDGELLLHDWDDYAGKLAMKREAAKEQTRERVKKYRQRAKKTGDPDACNADVTRYSVTCNADVTRCNAHTVHYTTQENSTQENSTQEGTQGEITPASSPGGEAEAIDYKRIADMYNETCVSFPHIRSLSEARKKAIRARVRSGFTTDDFQELFTRAEQSSFLKGGNGRNWSATFDWMIQDANAAKILDGNYTDKPGGDCHRNGLVEINGERYLYKGGKYYVPGGCGVAVDPYAPDDLPFL